MTTRAAIKDVSIIVSNIRHFDKYPTVAYLAVRHKNNLILDNIHVTILTNIAYISGISLDEKYFGLVVEWIVNNHKTAGNIRVLNIDHF